MKIQIHRADSRMRTKIDWLDSYHSFSFGHHHNPAKMGFGRLRVLNDDIIKPGQGFGTHPHSNMEIISIPLSGSLTHSDSTGTRQSLTVNEVQVMTAGSGIMHSEFNASQTDDVNFLQIWIYPRASELEPRYKQQPFNPAERSNRLQSLVGPDEQNGQLMINQDAWISRTDLSAQRSFSYQWNRPGNGVYLFVISGTVTLGDDTLYQRDAAGITSGETIEISAATGAELLIIEVPLN